MHPALPTSVTDPLLVSAAFVLAISLAAILSLILSKFGSGFATALSSSEKVTSLEGTRGVLAFSVAIHHACCWYFYLATGVWSTGGHLIFERLAPFGVMQFFYISGFLFWRKLMRRGSIPLKSFYWSRFLRIGPVYYVCVLAAVLIGQSNVTDENIGAGRAHAGKSAHRPLPP